MNKRKLFGIVACAVLIKFFLFAFLVFHAPQNRFQNDSADYIESAGVISSQETFARLNADGSLRFDLHRPPGYSFFLAILRGAMKLPFNAVIFIQVLLTLLAAWITYKAAYLIDPAVAFLSAVIVLYDPPVSIYSLIILSETLFFLLLACFMFVFVRYLKDRRIYLVAAAALLLATATYTRAISYYLGMVVAVFIAYANLRLKTAGRAVTHVLVFLVVFYGLLGIWQSRNYRLTGVKTFASVIQGNPEAFGLCGNLSRSGGLENDGAKPVVYYSKIASRCLLSLLTRPGQFKYFKSSILSAVGKIFAYPWMIFWILGFIIGMIRVKGNIYYQFMLLVCAYFIAASIGGAGLLVGERFRVPMVPFIAVLSAYGWSLIYAKKRG
ncbi:MAG: glycosyltransferase family 39 protein [Candidatus Omnitrophota bacterium]